MLGSGIASSMLAATILYEVLADNPDLSPANLWRYQVAFYKECGARHAGVDVMKRFMLQASTKELRYMFESGLLSEEDLKKASIGELVTVDFQSAKQKAKYFLRKPILMLKLIDVVNKAAMVYRRGMKIPEKYDTQKIKRWEKRIKYFFKAPKMVESPV
jgi:flavin-dependent dehydrogenase